MKPWDVVIVYNEPVLASDNPDWASEAGVLASVDAISLALAQRGHRARTWPIGPSLPEFAEALARIDGCDAVFNLFEGFGGVGQGEAEITGLLELAGCGVTGSPATTLALTRDKARTKWLLRGVGLPTPDFAFVDAGATIDVARLDQLLCGGPVIVKPAHEDASLGIGPESIVSERAALVRQINQVRGRYGPVLVERFIAGREFNAATIALPDAELLPLSEIEFHGDGPRHMQIVTFDAKWATGSADERSTPVRCPAWVDQNTGDRIGQIALAAFQHAGCRDYARVDLRMDAAGQVYVLEVNSNPDLGPDGGFMRALAAAGIPYDEFVERLVCTAVARRGTAVVASRPQDTHR